MTGAFTEFGNGEQLVFVIDPVQPITVTLNNPSVPANQTVQAQAVLNDTLGDTAPICTNSGWSTSNGAIATVNASTGVITGVAAGTATITCTFGSFTGSGTVTVLAAPNFTNPPGNCTPPCALANATVNVAYSNPLTASGGTPPYVFTITAGALPSPMTLASGGTISGTPTGTGTSTFTVQLCDNIPTCVSLQMTITVNSVQTAAVPANWVNGLEWQGTTVRTVTMPGLPGGTVGGTCTGTCGSPTGSQVWTCGSNNFGPYTSNSPTSLQQAVNDIETCRTTNATGTTLLIPAGEVYTFTNTGGLVLPQTAGDTISNTNFLVINSTTPLPTVLQSGTVNTAGTTVTQTAGALFVTGTLWNGTKLRVNGTDSCIISSVVSSTSITCTTSQGTQTGVPYTWGERIACAQGEQDNLANLPEPGLRNVGCNGTALSYMLGTTVTTVPAGPFTFANGTATNTSNFNDVASMYQIQCSTSNCSAISTATWDSNNQGVHHWAIFNAQLNPTSGLSLPGAIVLFGSNANAIGGTCPGSTVGECLVSQIPSHIHMAYDYIHGDWNDANCTISNCISTATGANQVPHGISWSCINCSISYSYADRLLRPGAEGHVLQWNLARIYKVVHNIFEGQAIGSLCGGFSKTLDFLTTNPTFIVCQDVEDRGNKWTYPYSWILAHNQGSSQNPPGGSFGRKNAHEYKFSDRVVNDGDIFENADYSGAQGNNLSLKSNQCSAGALCANYTTQQTNSTITNNISRHGCANFNAGFRSNNQSGGGGGVAGHAAFYNYSNNLAYDMSTSNPGCQGSPGNYGIRNSEDNTGTIWSVSTMSRTSNVATLVLIGSDANGNGQTQIQIGDPILVHGCTVDTSFNTSATWPQLTLGPPALAGTLTTGLTIVYASTGANVSGVAGTNCIVNNAQGNPDHFFTSHNTDTLNFNGANDPTSPQLGAGGGHPCLQSTNNTYKDSIHIGGGMNTSAIGEGTRFANCALNAVSLDYHDNVIPDRDPIVTCPGHSAGAGGIAACYTQYNAGVPTFPPVTLYGVTTRVCTGNDPTVGNCLGMVGEMSTTVFNYNLSDYHGYRLCKTTDAACNNKASQFAAGQTHQADDGTDLGVNMSAIDAAQINTQYCSSCGSFVDH